MFGNLRAYYSEIVEHGDCPITQPIGGFSPLHLIRACSDEQWREMQYRMQFSPELAIIMPNLGKFQIRLAGLRRYLYFNLAKLRNIRPRVEKILESDPEATPEKYPTLAINKDLQRKFRASWAQLEIVRKNMIIKNIQWNIKKIDAGESHRIKFHYENIDYQFVRDFIKQKAEP